MVFSRLEHYLQSASIDRIIINISQSDMIQEFNVSQYFHAGNSQLPKDVSLYFL
ncbi:hypothetical protein LFU01_24480 [Lysinibacillus fusiformis]|nr:hypothetical protein LFU01_24480 [Lysinibacillus fusiformis]